MKDYGLRPDETLAPADRAVKYLLDRIQHDADLRWIVLGTTAFGLLVEAEAARLAATRGAVCELREVDLRSFSDRKEPEVVRLRARVEELEEAILSERPSR